MGTAEKQERSNAQRALLLMVMAVGLMPASITTGKPLIPATKTIEVMAPNGQPGLPPKERAAEGGDRLPFAVDPRSAGSCAIVSKREMCADCCNEQYTLENDHSNICLNECDKAETHRREH
jgi:hypothetical protein